MCGVTRNATSPTGTATIIAASPPRVRARTDRRSRETLRMSRQQGHRVRTDTVKDGGTEIDVARLAREHVPGRRAPHEDERDDPIPVYVGLSRSVEEDQGTERRDPPDIPNFQH